MKLTCRQIGLATRRRGATVVEFAIVAPFFFLLIVALLEVSRLNVIRHTADNAAYEAARHTMVPGATASEAVDKAVSVLNVVGTRGAEVSVVPPVLGPNVEEVTVNVRLPMDQNGWVVPRFTKSSVIEAQSTLMTERRRE